MSSSNKQLKIKRERENSKKDSSTKKIQKSIRNREKIEIELFDEDIDEENLDEQKQENTLSQITINFLKYIKKKGRINININDLVKELAVKKRRLYDITNVLQGLGYIEKKGKNEISWTKNYKNQNMTNINSNSLEENYIANYKQLKIELENLKKEDKENEDIINKYREEFNILSKRQDFPKYSYITFNDISNLSKNDNLDFMIIKAKKGTVINVIDDEESKKAYSKIENQMKNGKILKNEKLLLTLNNTHHIFISNKEEKLKIYRVHNGEITEILKNHQNKIENNHINKKLDINNLTPNNNFSINNNEQTNITKQLSIIKNKNLNIKEAKNQSKIFNFEQNNLLNNTQAPQFRETSTESKNVDNLNNNAISINKKNNNKFIFTFENQDNIPNNTNNVSYNSKY